MNGPLGRFVVAELGLTAVLFGFRAVIYILKYGLLTDIQNGDLGAVDRYHTYNIWNTIDWLAVIIASVVVTRLQRGWMDAGNANALTRPDIGLGWWRDVPSGKTFRGWQLAQAVGFLAMIVLSWISWSHSADALKAYAVIQITLNVAVVASSIGTVVAARRMTAQLLERLQLSEQAEQARRAERVVTDAAEHSVLAPID